MASLRVIPYHYVPKKQRPYNNDQRSSVDKHPSTHHITQQSKLGVLPEKALQSLIAESPGDARGTGENSRHDSVYEAIADEPARRGIQDPASIPNAEVSLGGAVADQDTLGRETDYGQVEFTENGTNDIDTSSDFDFDSVFGDIDALFEEQEVSSVIEYNGGHATNLHTDASASQTDSLASEKEFAKTNTPSSCSYQLSKRRTSTKWRRAEDNLSVFVNGSGSDSGTSDESESIFEVRRSKRSKPESPTSSPDSSIYSSDVEGGVVKTGKHLNTHYPVPVVELIERENKSTAIGPGGTSNPTHDIDPQIDDGDLDSDDVDDELCHSPSWYRFGPSAAKSNSDDNLPGFARPCYVAQVHDASRDREFHNIIGKEYVNGEVHYMVDWVPTLVRGHILRKAQAQPLISSFEARCQSYKEGGKGHGDSRSNGYGATGGTQQRKRRGRPRNQV